MAHTLQREKVKIEIPDSKFYFETPSCPMVAPNDQELDFIRSRTQETCRTPIAVRVRQFKSSEMPSIGANIVSSEKQAFKNICDAYPSYEFIFFYQFREGYRLTGNQVKAMEDIQKIDNAHFITFYEPDTSQHANNFDKQLTDFIAGNKDRIVIPLLDSGAKDTTNLAIKAVSVINHGCKICGVISRHYKERGWNRIMPILKEAGIYVIVFGIYPRYETSEDEPEYSLLVPPLLLGADVVSHGRPWSGGPSKLRFLGNDWIYHRREMPGNSRLNYEISRAEAIITSNRLCEEDLAKKEPLAVAIIKEGFRHFANDMGLFDKGRVKSLKDF